MLRHPRQDYEPSMASLDNPEVISETPSAEKNPENDLNYYAKPENYGGSKQSVNIFIRRKLQRDRAKTSLSSDRKTTTETHWGRLSSHSIIVKPLSASQFREEASTLSSPETRSKTGGGGFVSRRISVGNDSSRQRHVHQADPPKPRRVSVVGSSSHAFTFNNFLFEPFETDGCSANGGNPVRLRDCRRPSVQSQQLSLENSNEEDIPSGQRNRASSFSISLGGGERRRLSITPLHRIRRNLIAKLRFRRVIRYIIIGVRLFALTEKIQRFVTDESSRQHKTFTDIASEAIVTDDGYNFDLSHYRAKKEINISNEVRYILSIPPEIRTPEQVQTAVYGLQHLESFAEYPLHLQEKLCKVGWFQRLSEKRVIIRQGHLAENFYFILAGQAVVRFFEQNPTTGETQLRTAAMLRQGSSFGELALLHHSPRTATVISQSNIQLLTISSDDFFEIIMGQSLTGDIPDHIKYLSTIDFMKDWPMEKLLEKPDSCVFLYFKRGTVIVKDSNSSEWLYIIKTGSCRVLKQLMAVVPRTQAEKKLQELKHLSPMLAASMEFAAINLKISTTSQCRPVSIVPGTQRRPASADPRLMRFNSSSDESKSSSGMNGRCRPATARRRAHQSSNRGSVFVQVEQLKPRDVFGLRTVNFELECPTDRKVTSVSLVSNGAECIMLSKKCFLDNANEKVRHQVRHQVASYPAESVLQENLQVSADWLDYKRQLIDQQRSLHTCINSCVDKNFEF